MFGTAILLLFGFLTPIVSIILGSEIIGNWLLGYSQAPRISIYDKPSDVLAFAIAIAIVLLGPGALSLDARLFGRREIIIPPRSHSSKS